MPYTITPGIKLSKLPVEQKVMLRLVWFREQKKTKAELRAIAKEIGSTFTEVMKSVVSLAKQQAITFEPITANEFEFVVDTGCLQPIRILASGYQKHLKVRSEKGLRPIPRPPPPHLTPITEEMRAPLMQKAQAAANRIVAPKLAFKVANCMVRIGEEEVNKLVETALKNPVANVSVCRAFFTLYSVRRDLLLPAPAPK